MTQETLPLNSILIQGVTLPEIESMFERLLDEKLKVISQITPVPKEDERGLMTRKETAKILRVSLPTLHSWTKIGVIKSRKVGTSIRYTRKDIEDALQNISK